MDPSEARASKGQAKASAPGDAIKRSPSKIPKHKEISRPGRQREARWKSSG